MDFSSVVKAVRDPVVIRGKGSSPLLNAFRSASSAVESGVSASDRAYHTVAYNLRRKNVWQQDSFASNASIQDASLVQENPYLAAMREERQLAREAEKERKLEESYEKAKEVIAALNQRKLALRFDTAKDFENARIINVIDSVSNEIIRQIPSEEFLRIAAAIREYEQRLAHDEMVVDPAIKAKGVETANVNENLRGAMFDAMA
ncbi:MULTISPECIES: flagellar protein FlaG [unclassified Anaerobiospirillum]|uniref:flagellar protein FlaG n=1 Tax=unclassified Anaerobiospirillum TaxID=2647410 RepID=UPI001FF2BC2C|nr:MULTISPECIES: flagellar protein FlaG [unclassified Anaerobiospirillum]MCK0526228.1 flagellar protein FlaG [Anaerobiospirillum sp. NML120449]MCK0534965.1 flagellar protein FlaG [Anaerobiospirillum sp. NML120511]MCK0540406.1 flagellar protein FlaG [Anaerobiospirillum sp. NML02-A-032]